MIFFLKHGLCRPKGFLKTERTIVASSTPPTQFPRSLDHCPRQLETLHIWEGEEDVRDRCKRQMQHLSDMLDPF